MWIGETADGRWAVTLDLLEQAPKGPEYRRAAVDDGRALERALDDDDGVPDDPQVDPEHNG